LATFPATAERYSKPAIFFHWAIFLLVALAYLAIEIRGPKGSDSRALWNTVHYCAGTAVLALAVLRLLWRLWRGAPHEIDSNRVLTFLSRVVHLALYLFIFVQPLHATANRDTMDTRSRLYWRRRRTNRMCPCLNSQIRCISHRHVHTPFVRTS
jgi:cytochrome b561